MKLASSNQNKIRRKQKIVNQKILNHFSFLNLKKFLIVNYLPYRNL